MAITNENELDRILAKTRPVTHAQNDFWALAARIKQAATTGSDLLSTNKIFFARTTGSDLAKGLCYSGLYYSTVVA